MHIKVYNNLMAEHLFIDDINPRDELYRIIRDEDRCIKYKSYMEHLWNTYQPYADKDFPKQLSQDFHARFWEMYLTCTLISKSFPVVPKNRISECPDIVIDDSPRRIFIEAVTCDEGAPINPDRVPELPVYDVNTIRTAKASVFPENEILLRYTGKILDKYKGYVTYLEKGIVSKSDSYIIALNSCKIRQAILGDGVGGSDYPLIVKAVLPVGDKAIPISKLSGAPLPWYYQYRPNINRSRGSTIPTDLFLNDEYVGISGVLYSHTDIANLTTKPGDDFIFIHNPKATVNAIPNEYFKFGIEYIVEIKDDGFSIGSKDWREIR